MPFHAGKGGIFIGPNSFKNRAKKYLIPDFQGLSGTTAITGRYYRSVWVIPPPDKGGTTVGSNNPSGATAGQDFSILVGH